jgi:hypothetical protein
VPTLTVVEHVEHVFAVGRGDLSLELEVGDVQIEELVLAGLQVVPAREQDAWSSGNAIQACPIASMRTAVCARVLKTRYRYAFSRNGRIFSTINVPTSANKISPSSSDWFLSSTASL